MPGSAVGTSAGTWLARHDPGLLTLRRAARVAVVACLAFYACRYLLGNAGMAPYALFGAVALGALSQIPGSPAERARTLLAVLPVGWVLISLGTLLSVSTATAVLGMFVLGFAVSYVGVGGPRLVGLAAGMQLLYILPCFPPYDPGSLPWRLAGFTLSVLLLAAAELVLWPDPAPATYRSRLAGAVSALAGCLDAVADCFCGHPEAHERLAAMLPEAAAAAEALRPSRLPPTQRPASAGRRDRALASAAGTARLLLGRAVDLSFAETGSALALPAAAALLRQTASCAEAAGAWLRGEEEEIPDSDRIAAALVTFREQREATDPDGLPAERLRLGSLARTLGVWTASLVTTIRVAAGAPIPPDTTPPAMRPGPLWFAYHSTPWLWWHRLREHLTPRSVYFQGALRLAAALAAARLLAGILDLSHGFWVLLTILTVLRASAAETRSALRPAIVGTALGSVVAAALLVAGVPPTAYAVALPVVMLVGFAAGPLLGPGWAQCLFTLVITFVFAQVAPVDWHLAEARIVDVLLGAGIGVLIGLLAWPRGGSGELHRASSVFLADGAQVVRETVGDALGEPTGGAALPRARTAGRLADASFALYQTERHGPGAVDWQATLAAGHHVVRGAEVLARECPAERPLPAGSPLPGLAADVADGFERLASALRGGFRSPVAPPPRRPAVDWPTTGGADLYRLADVRVWLEGLRDDLDRVARPPAAGDESDLRVRVAHLADGAAG